MDKINLRLTRKELFSLFNILDLYCQNQDSDWDPETNSDIIESNKIASEILDQVERLMEPEMK